MGGSNQSLFLIGALVLAQGTGAIPLLVIGLLLSWAAAPGWLELVLMWPERVGGIAATCAEAFRPYSPVLANLTGVSYWWGWVPTCGLTAILSGAAIHEWYLPQVPVSMLATCLVLLFMGVNLMGIKTATRVAMPIACASASLAVLSVLTPVLAGRVDWHRAASFHLSSPFHGFFGGLTSAMAGLYLIGFGAPAFEAATCHVGETKDPARNVKRALVAAGAMASLYFVAIPIVWLGVLGHKPLESNLIDGLGPTFAPLLGAGAKGAAIWLMMLNMFHGTLQPLAGASRTLSQLSEDGLLPRSWAKRSARDVPWVATLLTAAVSIAFLQAGDPTWLIAAANLCYLIGIGMPSVAVWLLRRNEPDRDRPFRAPRGLVTLGLAAAISWLITTILGFEQFGLPTVIASLGFAYAGAALYAWRVVADRRRRGLPGLHTSLHIKLTGAMITVMAFDGAGYLLAVSSAHAERALKTGLEDIFVVVALLTITVGLVLPGAISQAVGEVARGAERLASGTLSDLTRAMQALARGDLSRAHARKDVVELTVRTHDELGTMARTFNAMQTEVKRAATALDGAREGLAAAETRLQRYAGEQTALARSEQAAREETERANKAKSEFLSRVSHELRTPLNAILGFGQLLELESLEPQQSDSVKQILRGGRHLVGLIDDLLDISSIESGNMDLALEPVELEAVMREVITLCDPLAAEHGIALSSELQSGAPWVMADRQRLKQVLLNLLSNAIKYNRRQGSVRVAAAAQADGCVMLSVTDTGVGIAEEQRERLFSPFDRLDAADRGVEGTGLGLTLSKTLVEAMGGQLLVRSQVDVGSTFIVLLAGAEAGAPAAAGASAATIEGVAENGPRANGSRGIVMCVEDNPTNLLVVEQLISSHIGAEFVPATTGGIALQLARDRQPDLILLDLHLPDITGAEVLTRLRSDASTTQIPVIVLSADANEWQVRELMAMGAEDYLTKPFDIPHLLSEVSRYLHEHDAQTQAV
jgi:signal transduction histidine kinase/amino acid transporter/CheY-like chemotaxis protein